MGLPRWLPWALLAALAVVSTVLYARGERARGRAQLADSVASERLREAERDSARADSVVDALAHLDSVHAVIRDNLNRTRRALARASRESEAGAIQAGDSLEATLTALRPRVRAPLRPAVDTAHIQLQSLRAGYEAALSASREEIRATEALLTSCRARISVRDSAIQALEDARSSCSDALSAMTDARNRWRDVANPPFWQKIFGENLLQAAGIVGVNVAAWMWDEKAGVGATGLTLIRLTF